MLRTGSTNSRRRSSSSTNGLAVGRRSSVSLKDLEYIQEVINVSASTHIQKTVQRTKTVSTQLICLIIVFSPIFIHCYYPFVQKCGGNFTKALNSTAKLSSFLPNLRHPFPWFFAFGIFPLQFLFFWLLPADERFQRNANGELYRQRWNCFSAGLLQILLFALGAAFGLYEADVLFRLWDSVMVALSVMYLLIHFYLIYFSGQNESDSENPILQFYFGRELQPVAFDMDIKAFVTNRIAFPIWATFLVSAFARQRVLFGKSTLGFGTVGILQMVYICRRLWMDPSAADSLDNQNDRLGFYRLWGVLVFLPTLYLTPTVMMAETLNEPSKWISALILGLGLLSELFSFLIEYQKAEFRRRNGDMKIGGKDPFYLVAKYKRENGEAAANLLLGSGCWGWVRHPNYAAELLIFSLWTLPTQMEYPIAWLPVAFLAILLWGRISRDELRCLLKYQQSWVQYTSRVRYRLIPNVY